MPGDQKHVYVFPNGLQVVFIDGEQAPDLQAQPWIALLFQFFEAQGQDPTSFTWEVCGRTVIPFRTTEGRWNWRF